MPSHQRPSQPTNFEHDPLFQSWSAAVRAVYLAFSTRLMRPGPLTVTVGKGGLSYYKATPTASVFVCHFNAQPQRQRTDLGFADFRFDALRPHLNLEATLQTIQQAAAPTIRVKVNKLWCSLHFALTDQARVADIFVEHIIAKVR